MRAASDVVIRHLRLRPGPSRESSSNVDAIGIFDSHDVILDHLSLQWATDELLDIGTLRGSAFDITVQDSLLAWGLDLANHPKGKHSKGALICAMAGPGECGRISLLRNLFAHNRDRNPDVKGTSIGPVEIVNNVFYNPRSEFGEFYDDEGDLRINYIGNTALSGPSTRASGPPYAIDIRNDYSSTFDAWSTCAITSTATIVRARRAPRRSWCGPRAGASSLRSRSRRSRSRRWRRRRRSSACWRAPARRRPGVIVWTGRWSRT